MKWRSEYFEPTWLRFVWQECSDLKFTSIVKRFELKPEFLFPLCKYMWLASMRVTIFGKQGLGKWRTFWRNSCSELILFMIGPYQLEHSSCLPSCRRRVPSSWTRCCHCWRSGKWVQSDGYGQRANPHPPSSYPSVHLSGWNCDRSGPWSGRCCWN